jgi:hypothetical protein
MARNHREVRRDLLAVRVAACRVRLQTGEPTVFLDARKEADWTASALRIAGALRAGPEDRTFRPPCHQRNYLVVYCA